MRFRDVGLSLLGSAVVYVAMAACSSGGGSSGGIATKSNGVGGSSGASGAGSTNGAGGSSGAGPRLDSGIFDALTDPVSSASADPTDGARLKAYYLLGADGSKEYIPGLWFDSMRNEQCSFGIAGDGQTRCMPDGVSGQEYADSLCTQPVLAVTTGCTTPTYALSQAASATCSSTPGGTSIYTLGAATNPSTIYVESGGQCFQAGSPSTGFAYYSLGTEIPATSFVAATQGHD